MNAAAAATCPHLGMNEDPSAYYSYASIGNRCYHCKRPVSPLLTHQEAYCLRGKRDCPVYLQDGTGTFPADLRPAAEAARQGALSRKMGLGIVVGVIALGFTVMQFFLPVFGLRALIPATGQSPSAAAVEPQLAAPVAPPSAVPTTTVPAASPSAAPQTHALEVPFEIDGLSLLMHRVGDGETFEVIDLKYKTTPEVIRALNPSVGASLWAGSVIVIASGMQAVDASLPGFKTHEVDEPTTTIDKVALEYNIDVALLMRYNGCADACELSKGDWVLIPVPKQ